MRPVQGLPVEQGTFSARRQARQAGI